MRSEKTAEEDHQYGDAENIQTFDLHLHARAFLLEPMMVNDRGCYTNRQPRTHGCVMEDLFRREKVEEEDPGAFAGLFQCWWAS